LTSIARAVRVNRPYHADAKNSPVEAAVSAAPNHGPGFLQRGGFFVLLRLKQTPQPGVPTI